MFHLRAFKTQMLADFAHARGALHADLAEVSSDVPAFVQRLSRRFNLTISNRHRLASFQARMLNHTVLHHKGADVCFTKGERALMEGECSCAPGVPPARLDARCCVVAPSVCSEQAERTRLPRVFMQPHKKRPGAAVLCRAHGAVAVTATLAWHAHSSTARQDLAMHWHLAVFVY